MKNPCNGCKDRHAECKRTCFAGKVYEEIEKRRKNERADKKIKDLDTLSFRVDSMARKKKAYQW